MTRLLRWMLPALALGLVACHPDQTGLELLIETPVELEPGVDFTSLRVQVIGAEAEAAGDTYPITPQTERPYRVYVWPGEKSRGEVKVNVRLLYAGTLVREFSAPGIAFTEGELTTHVVRF